MSEITQITYDGTVPGADANTYVLFSTVNAGMGAGMAQANGHKKLTLAISNPQVGTLNLYRGIRTATVAAGWDQVSTTAVAAVAATTTNMYEFLIESFPHFKLEWVNGGVIQTGWVVDLALEDERHAV